MVLIQPLFVTLNVYRIDSCGYNFAAMCVPYYLKAFIHKEIEIRWHYVNRLKSYLSSLILRNLPQMQLILDITHDMHLSPANVYIHYVYIHFG